MIMFKVVCKQTGLEGCRYYKTREEAEKAAAIRTALSHFQWVVKMVILR